MVAQLVKNPPAMQETLVDSWVGIGFPEKGIPTLVFLGFSGGSDGKESNCKEGDIGLILGWEDPLEEGMETHSGILA